MNKNTKKLTLVALVVIALAGVLASGWTIIQPGRASASDGCKVTIFCPDKRKLTCEGEECNSNVATKDPYCIADGEIQRCSDRNKKDKKKKDKDSNSNSETSNRLNANGNTQ